MEGWCFAGKRWKVSDERFGFIPRVYFLFPVPWLVGFGATIPSFVGGVWELLDAPGHPEGIWAGEEPELTSWFSVVISGT